MWPTQKPAIQKKKKINYSIKNKYKKPQLKEREIHRAKQHHEIRRLGKNEPIMKKWQLGHIADEKLKSCN